MFLWNKDFWSSRRNSCDLWIFYQKYTICHLFEDSNISKLPANVMLENWIHIFKCFNQALVKTFKNWSSYAIAWSTVGWLKIPSNKMKFYWKNLCNISAIPTMVVIIFWEFLIFYQMFLLPQVKRGVIVSNKNSIWELSHELLINLKLRILGN